MNTEPFEYQPNALPTRLYTNTHDQWENKPSHQIMMRQLDFHANKLESKAILCNACQHVNFVFIIHFYRTLSSPGKAEHSL